MLASFCLTCRGLAKHHLYNPFPPECTVNITIPVLSCYCVHEHSNLVLSAPFVQRQDVPRPFVATSGTLVEASRPNFPQPEPLSQTHIFTSRE